MYCNARLGCDDRAPPVGRKVSSEEAM